MSKRNSNKYTSRLLFILAVVVFPGIKIATATDARSQPAITAPDPHPDGEIPTGFKLERYASVWERNPFTLVAPTVSPAQRSAFEKLFLSSWLKDDRSDVVLVQNSETNEVQRITTEANEGNLRLVALHLDANPQLVEAVISDGKEQGPVKFRFDVRSPPGQMSVPAAKVTRAGVPAQASNPAQMASGQLPAPPANRSNDQTSALAATKPVNQPLTRRLGSGSPRAQMQGGPRSAPHGASEGVRLSAP